MIAKLKKLLGFSVDVREARFDSVDGIDTLGDQPFVSRYVLNYLMLPYQNAAISHQKKKKKKKEQNFN